MSQSDSSTSRETEQADGGTNRLGQSSVSHEYTQHYVTEPAKDLLDLATDYAREKPDVAAMWAFGLGILVGWKLKG